MALGLTQHQTEMNTGSKGGRCVGLTNLPPSCADYLEIWEPQPPGTLRACTGIAVPFNSSGVPRNFVRGGRGSTNSVEDREKGDWGR